MDGEVLKSEMILSSLVTLFILKNPTYNMLSPFRGGTELTTDLVNSGQTHNFPFIARKVCRNERHFSWINLADLPK